ncbi:SGNH/GDSL hydrolase family protein [Noviluteimonas dokdonensis]|uniref:SGNH/GDSL hydrolase family protein n=1 Tax=Noviluteimonas dokdonensis TaxID=414050 RepID=UPI000A6F5365|nr:hypothetical protein [Lysobacter dokdonensis]
MSAAKYAIQQGAADVNILVIGDSTGNDTTEWVYLFAQWLEAEYPSHAVSYRLWNDGGNVYDAAVAIGTGTGSRTIRIWNASVAGVRPAYFTGSKFAPAISSLTTPDLVIWSHGKNNISQAGFPLIRGDFLAAMEMVRQAHPTSAHAVISQNPNRDDDDYLTWIDPTLREICADRGDTTLINVYGAFAGKASSLYLDNLHPSDTGSALWASVVQGYWRQAAASPFTSLAAWLNTQATNLITNGDFSTWTGAVPTGWTVTGSGTTTTKDTGEVDGASPYSARVNCTAASSILRFSAGAPLLASLVGKTVTLAVRQKIPVAQASTVGRIAVAYTGGAMTSSASTYGQGAWRWLVLSGVAIPAGSAFLRCELYGDSAASAGSTVYYDRAILVEGDIPRDML